MLFEVKFVEPAEGLIITELMTEDQIIRAQCNDCRILSVEPSQGSKEKMQAEITAYGKMRPCDPEGRCVGNYCPHFGECFQ
jgi:hypothetical protein